MASGFEDVAETASDEGIDMATEVGVDSWACPAFAGSTNNICRADVAKVASPSR